MIIAQSIPFLEKIWIYIYWGEYNLCVWIYLQKSQLRSIFFTWITTKKFVFFFILQLPLEVCILFKYLIYLIIHEDCWSDYSIYIYNHLISINCRPKSFHYQLSRLDRDRWLKIYSKSLKLKNKRWPKTKYSNLYLTWDILGILNTSYLTVIDCHLDSEQFFFCVFSVLFLYFFLFKLSFHIYGSKLFLN